MNRRWGECVAKLEGTRATIHTDGGAWPHNPGHGAMGVVVSAPDGTVVRLEWGYLGSPVSSNEAEYAAIWRALEVAKDMGLTHVNILCDSQLVVKQLTGVWEVQSDKFGPVNRTFDAWVGLFEEVTLKWVPREENTLADAMVTVVRGHDWGEPNRTGTDGREKLGEFLVAMFERNGVNVLKYEGGYIHLEGCLVKPLPFYHREAGVTYPSTERTVLEDARRKKVPVVFAWRPQGMHADVMTQRQIGRLFHQVENASDGRVQPMFAFASDVLEREPGGRKMWGYRGSRVLILEGPWRTVGEFFWFREKVEV